MNFELSDQDILYLIYTGIAVGVLVLFSGLSQLISTRENHSEAKSRRLRMIAKGATTEELLALFRPPEKRGWRTRIPFFGDLENQLRKADLVISPRHYIGLCGAGTMAIFIFVTQLTLPQIALLISGLIGFGVPMIVVNAKAQKRIGVLIAQLPDALELMARGLRVGHPLNSSIRSVAAEMPDPIGTEFGMIFDQINYGDELVDAFSEFADRTDVEDVRYLAASIGIQHGTGGDLVRVLEVLSKTIRGRAAMRKRIHAISSEGRMTAWFLSILPFGIFAFTMVVTPDYYGGVMDDPMFVPMAVAVVLFVAFNALILKKLVSFRI
ncbi:type II secretion system F family protein [Marimonas sp. MJW-29]|uniref:Type II secretion system F family protein n=1 Tax=Sulfitobacter sediminis TaxID=3234186 RepID=A0ABV3RT90_9RHOB